MTVDALRRPFVEIGRLADRTTRRPVSSGFGLAGADWRLLLILFVATRALLAAGIFVSYLANTARMETGPDDMFCNWDCDWYTGIAESGYQQLNQVGASGLANWAFFPLLPMLMWAVSTVTELPTVYSGLVVAQVGWSIGLYLIFLLARDLRDGDFARHAAIVYAGWPFAIHASMPMTEAVFVPVTIATILFARRGNWLIVAIVAVLLSASRTVGVVVVIPLLVLAAGEFGFWRIVTLRPGTERAFLALAASGLGLGLYMAYLYGLTGDAMAFSHNQAAWNRQFELPWMMILDELNPAYISPSWLIANALDIASAALAFVLFWYLWRRGLRAEALFGAVSLSIACLSGNSGSLPRYAGGLYPLIVSVAFLCEGPLRRVPAYAFLFAGQFGLAFAWGMEQFYVM